MRDDSLVGHHDHVDVVVSAIGVFSGIGIGEFLALSPKRVQA